MELALNAQFRERLIQFHQTKAIISAIIFAGDKAASAGSDSQASPDSLNKSLDELRDLLLPEFKQDTEEKAKRYAKILESEGSKGPLKIQTIGTDKKMPGRVVRNRRD